MRVDVTGWKLGQALMRLSLGLAFVLVCGLSFVKAQTGDTGAKSAASAGKEASSSSTENARPRRADEAATDASDDSAKGESADAANDAAPTAAKSTDRLSTLREQIEGAKTDAERARLRRLLVDYLVALNQKPEALKELREMMREDRIDPIGFYNIGNALARLGDTDTAIDAYRKAIKQRHGNYSRALNNLGVMLLRQGRWDEAQEPLLAALRLENFRYSEASYNLGRLYAARGEADLAIREWSRALVVQPDHADAAISLARAYAEDGRPERGLALLDTFIARRGPSTELTDARREILFTRGENEVAITETKLDAVGTTKVSDPNGGARGGLKERNDTDADARKSAGAKTDNGRRASMSLRPLAVDQQTYDLLQRARAAREDGRDEDAVSFYRQALTHSNGLLPPANLELGFVLNNLKRYDEAAASFKTLASREGARYTIAYYHLGRQYEMLGQLPLAAEAYEKAAAAYGDSNPQFLLDVSRIRDKEGNTAAALAAMEAYVRISQSHGSVPEWATARLAELREKARK